MFLIRNIVVAVPASSSLVEASVSCGTQNIDSLCCRNTHLWSMIRSTLHHKEVGHYQMTKMTDEASLMQTHPQNLKQMAAWATGQLKLKMNPNGRPARGPVRKRN